MTPCAAWNYLGSSAAVDPLQRRRGRLPPDASGHRHRWSQRSLAGFEFDPVPDARGDVRPDRPRPSLLRRHRRDGLPVPLDDLPGLQDRMLRRPVARELSLRGADLGAAGRCGLPGRRLAARPHGSARRGRAAHLGGRAVARAGSAASRRCSSPSLCKGVHSLMTFFTLCANLGRPCSARPGEPLVDREAAADSARRHARSCLRSVRRSARLEQHRAARGDGRAMTTWSSARRSISTPPMRKPIVAGRCASMIFRACGDPTRRLDHRRNRPWHLSKVPGRRGSARLCRLPAANPKPRPAFTAHHGQPARIEAWTDPQPTRGSAAPSQRRAPRWKRAGSGRATPAIWASRARQATCWSITSAERLAVRDLLDRPERPAWPPGRRTDDASARRGGTRASARHRAPRRSTVGWSCGAQALLGRDDAERGHAAAPIRRSPAPRRSRHARSSR